MAEAIADYRELTGQARAMTDTPSPASPGTNDVAATLLGVTTDVQRAREQADAGDYAGAIETLQQIMNGAAAIRDRSERHAGAAEWTHTAAEQAAATLQRLADAGPSPGYSIWFETNELDHTLARARRPGRDAPRGRG